MNPRPTPAPERATYDWPASVAQHLLAEPCRSGSVGDFMDPDVYEHIVLASWRARLYGPGYFGALGN